MDWKPIEKFVGDDPVWVILYLYWGSESDQAQPDYAGPWADVHGWYETEEEALRVRNHFPPSSRDAYRVKKAHRRVLI